MKKKAFTLAEVLIVMALIGFLFTLMLPTLVQKQSTTKFVDAAKEAQTKLQEAFNMTAKQNKNLPPLDWPNVRATSNKSDAIMKEIANNLQVMSFCSDSAKGCFASSGYKTLNGVATNVITDEMEPARKKIDLESENTNIYNQDESGWGEDTNAEGYEQTVQQQPQLQYEAAYPELSSTYVTLINGMSVALKTSSTKCDGLLASTDILERPLCGIIYVDVNGHSIPNMLGVDVFGFYISNNNILPMGFYGDEFSFSYNCLRETPKAAKTNGLGCTAWAIKNRNMEYRKCQAGTRLSWTDATRCDVAPKNQQ